MTLNQITIHLFFQYLPLIRNVLFDRYAITNLDFIKTSFVLVLNFLIIKILLKNLITF